MTSWIILNTRTGQPLCETYSPETVEEVRSLHKGTLEAVPKELWLVGLTKQKIAEDTARYIKEFEETQGDHQ